jgi:hypothetical protein
MKHFVVYTLLRFGLFLGTYAVLSGLAVVLFGDDREVFLVCLLLAAVLSSALSLKLLAGPRERFAQSVEARASRASAKLEKIRSREDAD